MLLDFYIGWWKHLQTIHKFFSYLLIPIMLACGSENTDKSIENKTQESLSTEGQNDAYLNGCNSYFKLYDKTERISLNSSNKFIGVYGFNETDSVCWDALYEEANNLVPPDTSITSQNVYFIRVKSNTAFKPVTALTQILNSDSLKKEVLASDNTFGDNTKQFPFITL